MLRGSKNKYHHNSLSRELNHTSKPTEFLSWKPNIQWGFLLSSGDKTKRWAIHRLCISSLITSTIFLSHRFFGPKNRDFLLCHSLPIFVAEYILYFLMFADYFADVYEKMFTRSSSIFCWCRCYQHCCVLLLTVNTQIADCMAQKHLCSMWTGFLIPLSIELWAGCLL